MLIASCQEILSKNQRILIDSQTYAEGSFGRDTVFQGLIKFVDRKTGNLTATANYENGVLDGETIDFYPDGRMKFSGSYEKGKLNGYVSFFDRSGNVGERQYYYYDLVVGPRIKYKNGFPKSYKFYSLENELLFHINYDSVYGNTIDELQKSFFYFNKREYEENENPLSRNNAVVSEYFIYIMAPPRFNFEYDLVDIDSSYKVKSIVKRFKGDRPWAKFSIKDGTEEDGCKAIRLLIRDSINNINTTMFRRL
jgi:hypothetical protein